MPGFSFSLKFSTEELAQMFVRDATQYYQVPCLRNACEVHVVAATEWDRRELLHMGHQLGGTKPKLRTLSTPPGRRSR